MVIFQDSSLTVMNSMTGNRIFLDSNILVYLASNDPLKKSKVISFISPDCVISTQVVSENINACIKKLKMSKAEAYAFGASLLELFQTTIIKSETIRIAIQISESFNFGYWDSLIIATALENKCAFLYSEDLQHNQVIMTKLTVINPFLI
jgi:predicted nucleic acid-binding protein